MSGMPDLHPDTVAVHAGREDLTELGVHAPPIDLSTTNPLASVESGGLCYEAMASGNAPPEGGSAVYARLWNPTVARFEDALARMEHAEHAVAFGSGMAAMTAAVLATSRATPGAGHIVAVRPLYGGTDHLLDSGLLGVDVDFVEADRVAEAITPETGLVIAETPANPTLDLVDIADVVRQAGTVPVLIDNTFATPVLQNPIDHGARLVLHSATKYLGGHGDVIAGAIACDREMAAALRRVRAVTGGLLHPLGAYLLHRGLTTLPTRVRAQQRTARILAGWLRGRPEIDRVYYPEFGDHDGLLGRQLRGPGAMLAIELRGGAPAVERLVTGLRLFLHAVSLGGVDSLVQAPAALTHRPVAAHARPGARVVRLSIGLEDPEDLIADLDQALTAAPVAPDHADTVALSR